MSAVVEKQTHEFQTEVSQLLKLMIHSLYSNQEIFLRELISNASDACDKLRFEALSDDSVYGDDSDLKIRVSLDKKNKTITVSDNGIGMSAGDVMEHLGTIAKSGTKEFFESLTGDQAKDAQLIGQFGVGFYSSFMVADKVTVTSRKAQAAEDEAVVWASDGQGGYTLEGGSRASRGTDVTLHLNKEAAKEFLEDFRLRNIIHKYSDHIAFPIQMLSTEDDKKDEWENVNEASALWAKPKKEITQDEYKAFYKHVAHDFDEPMEWIHNRVEGKQSYISLFYIPKRAPFDLYERDSRHGIKLYVKRVFIMDDAENLMPTWLRFVRGLVDSDDLPLNVSREILQKNKFIDSIRNASVKKILGMLESMAKKKPEQYAEFWKQFGRVVKEGPAEDYANRERILKLLRFSSTQNDIEEESVSLSDYVERMKPEQDSIYYVIAENFAAAKNSPQLGIFRKKGIEVLLMHDRVDEWMMSHLDEFDGKKFQSVSSADLDLGKLADKEEKETQEKMAQENKDLLDKMKQVLAADVNDVRISTRLTDAPSCIVQDSHDMSMHLQKVLKSAGHDMPTGKPTLEINADHPLIKRLHDEKDEDRFADWTRILFEEAVLGEGGELADPAAFVSRLNNMLGELSGANTAGRIIVD
jgi:molecular chaperone HtpG